jgi:hypothetical protein
VSSPTEQTHQLVGLYWIACPAPENRNETIGSSPSKTSWFARSRLHPAPEGTMRRRTPLMRFIKVPLRRSSSVRPLRSEDPAGKMPTPRHVPPMSFPTTTTVYSAQRPAGLLHPATDHRVRLVSPRLEAEASVLGFPRTPVHPSKRFPPCQPNSSHTAPNKSDVASPTARPLTSLLRCHSACCHTANLLHSTSGS